jgi:hypothetical protein
MTKPCYVTALEQVRFTAAYYSVLGFAVLCRGDRMHAVQNEV